MSESFLGGRVTLHCGDSRNVLGILPDASIDSVVTDPPYALVSVIQRFGNSPRSETTENTANPYGRTGRGFMGQKWDTGETAFASLFWVEVLRVLKPGGHLVAFSGTRTYHRMVVAIEDAGFEIRDQLAWVYGTGFPKSHNLRGEWEGWGTALKPAWEPICLARKPLIGTVAENVLQYGTGAINVDGCRVEGADAQEGRSRHGGGLMQGSSFQMPDSASSMPAGRWPANIVHDGSDEVVAAFPEAPGQLRALNGGEASKSKVYGKFGPKLAHEPRGDSGSAARFFYSAKADNDDRIGSKHPTVKPVDLMQWLCRLVTPPGGLVLDPFAGTGTTGEAAWREGFSSVLIEREAGYQDDIRRRMKLALGGPEERAREIVKEKTKGNPVDHGPLFGAAAE